MATTFSKTAPDGPLSARWVRLALPTTADFPALAKILNDRETMESLVPFFGREVWTDEQVRERYEKFQQAHIEDRGITWVVRSLPDGVVVGQCGFKNIDTITSDAEFGIILHRTVWGKGHALECHLLGLRYGFEILRLGRVHFNTDDHNQRMQRFFDKIGAPFTGRTGEGYLQYALVRSEWPAVSLRLDALIQQHATR